MRPYRESIGPNFEGLFRNGIFQERDPTFKPPFEPQRWGLKPNYAENLMSRLRSQRVLTFSKPAGKARAFALGID